MLFAELILHKVFYLVDEKITVIPQSKDGDSVKKGDIIAEVIGPSRGILTGERVALNLIQRLSGTATATAKGGQFHCRNKRKDC